MVLWGVLQSVSSSTKHDQNQCSVNIKACLHIYVCERNGGSADGFDVLAPIPHLIAVEFISLSEHHTWDREKLTFQDCDEQTVRCLCGLWFLEKFPEGTRWGVTHVDQVLVLRWFYLKTWMRAFSWASEKSGHFNSFLPLHFLPLSPSRWQKTLRWHTVNGKCLGDKRWFSGGSS